MAGRPAKPAHLKVVSGTSRSHKRGQSSRVPANPEAPRLSLDVPPPHLSPRAAECWSTVAPILDRMGVLTVADASALAELCESYAELTEARASLANPVEARDREGEFIQVGEAGALTYVSQTKEGWIVRPRPEVAMIAEASKRFTALLGQFGMTPSARSKIHLPDGDRKPDAVDQYFG